MKDEARPTMPQYENELKNRLSEKDGELKMAKIGFIALIDEATKYQEVRNKTALRDILKKCDDAK